LTLKLSNDFRRRIISAIAYPFIDKRTNRSLLVELHGEAFNSNLCKTCENEHIRAYIELYRLINPKEKSMNPPSKKYRFNPLREKEQLSLKGYRGVVTAENLTDDVAVMLIKQGIYGDLIVTVEEAESIRAKIESDSKIDYSKHTVAELKSILDDAGIDYSGASKKADFVSLAESM
jgi:hypothetical protein